MIEPVELHYRWGQRVVAASDLHNDGSYPDLPAEALLVSAGSPGEVVQVGVHTESGTAVYLVEFATGSVVGCREEEISPAGEPT